MTGCPVLTISLDKLVPLGASPVSDPFLDDGERERSDPGRANTAISWWWKTRNRPALVVNGQICERPNLGKAKVVKGNSCEKPDWQRPKL